MTKWRTFRRRPYSNAFSWIKIYEFWLMLHWILFLGLQFTISQHWFIYWPDADQSTSHYLNQWWSVYWRKYESRGLNVLSDLCGNMNIPRSECMGRNNTLQTLHKGWCMGWSGELFMSSREGYFGIHKNKLTLALAHKYFVMMSP